MSPEDSDGNFPQPPSLRAAHERAAAERARRACTESVEQDGKGLVRDIGSPVSGGEAGGGLPFGEVAWLTLKAWLVMAGVAALASFSFDVNISPLFVQVSAGAGAALLGGLWVSIRRSEGKRDAGILERASDALVEASEKVLALTSGEGGDEGRDEGREIDASPPHRETTDDDTPAASSGARFEALSAYGRAHDSLQQAGKRGWMPGRGTSGSAHAAVAEVGKANEALDRALAAEGMALPAGRRDNEKPSEDRRQTGSGRIELLLRGTLALLRALLKTAAATLAVFSMISFGSQAIEDVAADVTENLGAEEQPVRSESVEVERVTDGGRVVLEEPLFFTDTVALVGIDGQPDTSADDTAEYLRRTIEGEDVELEYQPDPARYYAEGEGYVPGYLRLESGPDEGELVNLLALEEGQARYEPTAFSGLPSFEQEDTDYHYDIRLEDGPDKEISVAYQERLQEAARKAENEGAGMWGVGSDN